MSYAFEFRRRRKIVRRWRTALRSHPILVRLARKIERKIKEIGSYKINTRSTTPEEIFKSLMDRLVEFIKSRRQYIKDKVLMILTPFLYRKYTEEFLKIVDEHIKDFSIFIVTRDPKFVSNREEHISSAELLKRKGVYVCQLSERFHAKAIIIDSEYVFAGSINILAPSHSEFIIETHIMKLIENPSSASTILHILSSKCKE